MTIYFKKSFLQSKEVKEFVKKSQLDEFKRRILEHLSKLEAKEKKKNESVQKALVEQERLNKAGYPVGTVREWKGKVSQQSTVSGVEQEGVRTLCKAPLAQPQSS